MLPNMTRGLLAVAALVLSTGLAPAQDLFDLQKVADGVYAALARPRTPINCNAAVIVYDEGVLVVDTHSRPSSARALIQQIKSVTDKPVRYAVNSHFHWDHAQGNHAYPVAFPKQVAIVASEATRENLITLGMQRVKEQIDNGPRQIDDVKQRLAAAQNPAAQAVLRDELRQQEEYLAEIRSLELTLPDLTFDKTLILHRPDRDVVLLFLGRGHTSGDVVAYLPKQRVVATGDLLHGWMPFMGDSYPPEWVATLDALDKLDFDHIIGGHGGVKPKSHLRFFRNYLSDLIAEVRRARDRSESLAQATTAVTAALAPKYDAGMEGRFAGSVGANIAKVYQDLVDKRYRGRRRSGRLPAGVELRKPATRWISSMRIPCSISWIRAPTSALIQSRRRAAARASRRSISARARGPIAASSFNLASASVTAAPKSPAIPAANSGFG